MLDIDLMRKDRDAVARALTKRMDPAEVDAALDEVLALDSRRRALLQEIEANRQKRKADARAYGAAKQAGTTPQDLPPPDDGAALAALEAELDEVLANLQARMSELPNLPSDDTIAGGKENNRVLRIHGEAPKLDKVRDHVTLAKELGLVDFERGVKLGGSGFWIYTGWGARLEWALVNYFIDYHVAAGYTFMLPPHLLLESAGYAAGQFPKFYDDVFHIESNESARGQFLLPTAETAILGAYQDEVIDAAALPIKAFGYTPCYRRESAGSHSDERGTVRGHQFNKVEIFQFIEPDQAEAVLEEMVAHAESLVEGLGLHYQRVHLAADDASASMRKTIDIEVWMPSMNKFKEVSSVSWAGDYQARRAGIRYKERGAKQTRFLHTLNGSALATSRIFPAILEQCQQSDGSVLVPEVLQSRVGAERIEPPARPSAKKSR
jgi:seryl-tRNA synthetase